MSPTGPCAPLRYGPQHVDATDSEHDPFLLRVPLRCPLRVRPAPVLAITNVSRARARPRRGLPAIYYRAPEHPRVFLPGDWT